MLLEFNEEVEIVFQGTSLVLAESHPMHLHGYGFYVVGRGFGNFDKKRDPSAYNLVDPPHKNTVSVPRNGWVAIRFKANNPGEFHIYIIIIREKLARTFNHSRWIIIQWLFVYIGIVNF